MLLPALSLAFLLHFSDATTTTCPEVVKDCPSDELYHQRVNETIREVLADLNKTSEAYEFMHDYEDRLHTFVVDLRVALLLDQRLLERLLYLQKKHGENFTAHPDFDKECDEHNIAKLVPEVTCPESVPECPSNVSFHIRVNETIREVLLDINVTTLALHDFISDYETRMHTFMVDLRVAMLKDQRLLERLVLLQKEHGRNFTGHPGFSEWCYWSRVDCPCPSTATVGPRPNGANCTDGTDEDCESTTDTGIYGRTTTALPSNGSSVVICGEGVADQDDNCTLSTTSLPLTTDLTTHRTETNTTKTAVGTTSTRKPTVTTTTRTTTMIPSTTTRPTTVTTTTRTTTRPSTTTTTATTTRTTTTKLVTPSDKQVDVRCEKLLVKVCDGCKSPEYKPKTKPRQFLCPEGTSFFKNQRTLFCVMDGFTAYVRHGNGTEYKAKLECKDYGEPPKTPEGEKRCKATCDKQATCKLYEHEEIICACQLGYADISAETNRQRGSVCKKCHRMMDVDFVIVYDKSGSIVGAKHKLFNLFINDLIKFLNTEKGDNRLALVPFATDSHVRVNLTRSVKEIREFLKDPKRDIDQSGEETNTAKGLYIANTEIYRKQPANSTRRRVTMVLTDGRPSICNQHLDFTIAPRITNETAPIPCMTAELAATTKEMKETHKADIFVVHVGEFEELDKQLLKVIYKDEDRLIHAADFGDLKDMVMAKLQEKIC